MAPLLSIIIPAYNVQNFISSSVQSALDQTIKNLEVIVIDDGSSDLTLQRISEINDPRLRIIAQKNFGLSAARNTGIRASKGEYIGFLDGDDIWYSKKAEIHLALLEKDSLIGITFSYSNYIDEQGNFEGRYLVTKIKTPSIIDLIVRNHIGNGSTPIIRRECFSKAGLFDESLRACEDYEMWVRIYNKTNYKAQLIPKVLTGYRVRSLSLTLNFDLFLHNAELVIKKFESDVPQLTEKIKRRALAEMYRIASTKALMAKQFSASVRFMKKAFYYCPAIFLTDIRAFVTFSLIAIENFLPDQLKYLLYKLVRRMRRLYFRRYLNNIS